MTRGRAATPEPFDLGAVAGSDELVEALSTRRLPDLSRAPADDPAAALLAALVGDVDAGAPPLPAPARVACTAPAGRRRGVRAIVTFGAAALVLTSAGAAAAGGGNGVDAMRAKHGPARIRGTERSNVNAQRQSPAEESPLADRRQPERHADRGHRDAPIRPRDTAGRPEGGLAEHHGPRGWSSRPHPPAPPSRTPDPGAPSPPSRPTPTPEPQALPLVP